TSRCRTRVSAEHGGPELADRPQLLSRHHDRFPRQPRLFGDHQGGGTGGGRRRLLAPHSAYGRGGTGQPGLSPSRRAAPRRRSAGADIPQRERAFGGVEGAASPVRPREPKSERLEELGRRERLRGREGGGRGADPDGAPGHRASFREPVPIHRTTEAPRLSRGARGGGNPVSAGARRRG